MDRGTPDLADKVEAFCQASVSHRPMRAARMLMETPEIAGYNLATAVLLGDAARVRDELERDPALVDRRDPQTGWSALHLACVSRWSQVEPTRADGLAAVAGLLIEAGADPTEAARTPSGRPTGWTPLRCTIASANSGPSNRAMIELLLGNDAVPVDHDVYLAGFAHDRGELMPLLLARVRDPGELRQALAAPISNDDAETVRLLLEAGADPRRYLDDDGNPVPAVWAAVKAGCSSETVELLLEHGADSNLAGPDGRRAYRLATAAGRADLVDLLRRNGAVEDATDAELLLSACMRNDRPAAQRLLDRDPELPLRLPEDERAMLVRAAEHGNAEAVTLMLDLGFPLDTRGEHGGTPLHFAAYSGSAGIVRLLLDHGADIESRDTAWNDTPLVWAAVGSGERPTNVARPDWEEAVRVLLARGASTAGITLNPDDPKPPSPEVAALLRAHIDPQRQ